MFVAAGVAARALGNGWLSLVCAIAAGAAAYLGGALLSRFPEIEEIRNIRK